MGWRDSEGGEREDVGESGNRREMGGEKQVHVECGVERQ